MRPLTNLSSLFRWTFAQFAVLQIVKSGKGIVGSGQLSVLALPWVILLFSTVYVLVWDANNQNVSNTLLGSFLVMALADGSVSNHVVTSVCLAVLTLLTNGGLKVAVRWFCALLYLVAGLHKLNSDFFKPHHSCGSLYVAGSLSIFPRYLVTLLQPYIQLMVDSAPYCAATFELTWPVLLLFFWGNFYKFAVLIGCVFHAVLALPPSPLSVYPFSAIMIPLYTILCPNSERLVGIVNKLMGSKIFVAFIVGMFSLFWVSAPGILVGDRDLFEYPNYGLWGVSVLWNSLWWITIFFASLGTTSGQELREKYPPVRAWPVLLFLVLLAMSPYVGLRTYPALAMFSNLRTEGENPNHFLPTFDLFGYQKDYVTVLRTNFEPIQHLQVDLGRLLPNTLKETTQKFNLSNEFYICPPYWKPLGGEGKFVPFSVPLIEIRRRMAGVDWDNDPNVRGKHIKMTWHGPRGNAKVITFDQTSPGEYPELIQPLTWFERLFVRFRTFSNEYSPCRH